MIFELADCELANSLIRNLLINRNEKTFNHIRCYPCSAHPYQT